MVTNRLLIDWTNVVLGALDVQLSEEEIKYLEEPYITQSIIGQL